MLVLFDVNGTLLDPGGLTAGWEGVSRGAGLRILDDAVAQSMVDTMTGGFRPFAEYLRSALTARAAVLGLGEDAVRAGVEAAAALPAYPDAADALARLKLAGATLAAVTNSAADAARSALRDAGLLDCFHAVVGADAVGAYKPDPRVYRRALDELAVAARRDVVRRRPLVGRGRRQARRDAHRVDRARRARAARQRARARRARGRSRRGRRRARGGLIAARRAGGATRSLSDG